MWGTYRIRVVVDHGDRDEAYRIAPFFHGISDQSETLPIYRSLRIELHLEVLRNTDPKVQKVELIAKAVSSGPMLEGQLRE
jgi:hypothetical protein